MMPDAIKNFPKQFEYAPTVVFGKLKKKYAHVIVAGMGGSHLAADLLKSFDPTLPVAVHTDYGLPHIRHSEKKNTLVVASSYSGNTEETIDALLAARKQKIDVAALSVGGKLFTLAKKFHIPFVQLPNTGIQPRSALGFGLKGLCALTNARLLPSLSRLSASLSSASLEPEGRELSKKLFRFVPVIYTSARNAAIGYNWKIKFNETGKIPAFYNIVPELNHNEMTGFDWVEKTKKLIRPFSFVFIRDREDHPRNRLRMDVLQKLYQKRGLPVHSLDLLGKTRWEQIFSSLLLADWCAYHTACRYGAEPEQVPMVEEFKKLVA